MKKTIHSFYILLVIGLLFLPAFNVNAVDKLPPKPEPKGLSREVNFTRKNFGIADVYFNASSDNKVKLLIQQGSNKYYYNLKNEDDFVSFPLQLGNGSYQIKIYENTVGSKYRKTYSSSDNVSIKDQKVVFLNSIQQIEWYNDDVAIEFAEELLADYIRDQYGSQVSTDLYGIESVTLTDREKIDVFYNYVVKNITYDYDKIKTLKYDYIPDIDDILSDQSGICYDYSVLLASMLRSQGIPSKLIKGYTSWTDVYHAWNEIYLADEDRWVVVDSTYDSYMYRRRRTYTFEKSREVYATSYAY